MLMPKHHVAKCSWRDCAYGETLDTLGYCEAFGIWWHPACPCWAEDDDTIPFVDLELFMEEQLVKDKLLNLLKWVGPDPAYNIKEVINTAFIEYKALLRAIEISEGSSLKETHKLMHNNSTIELVLHLLLLKLAVMDTALSKFLIDKK
jgi:hypothetical protein